MAEFSVSTFIFLMDYIIIWEIKLREIITKQYLETLIVLWIKWTGMVEMKHEEYIEDVPIMPCRNSLWIMGSRIYGEGTTQILQFTCYKRFSGTRSMIDRIYTEMKIANSTKINHIMVSFTDLYNAIFINRFPSKTKIRKDSLYFNNSL